MKTRFKVYLMDEFYAVLSLDMSIPNGQKEIAQAHGVSEQEQANLIGQKLQELMYLLGNTEEA